MRYYKNNVNLDKNPPDNSPFDRPATRKMLLRTMLSEHKFDIFFFSLAYTVVFLPACIWIFLAGLFLKSALSGGPPLPDQFLLLFILILFPALSVSGPGAAGLFRVARNWMRNQPLHPFRVFQSAVRDSWKNGLLLSGITGLLPILTFFAWIYYGSYHNTPLIFAAFLAFLFLDLLWLCMRPCLEVMAVTYSLPFPQMLWNGVYLTLRHPLKSLKMLLLAVLPDFITLLFCWSYPNTMMQLFAALSAYYVLYGFGLRQLLFAAYGNFLCEEYLNPHIPGAQINIGMRSEKQTAE